MKINVMKRRKLSGAFGVLAAILTLLPAQNLFAGSAPAFIALTPADAPYISYPTIWAVVNTDTVNGHWVAGSYGLWQGIGGSIGFNISGNNNGQNLQCTSRAIHISDGVVTSGSTGSTSVNGMFTITTSITISTGSNFFVSVACFIPKVSGGKQAELWGY